MDVVYPVRPGDDNDELRFSLRSLTNLDHDRVFIAGHIPAWVTEVVEVPVVPKGRKRLNTWRNMLAVVNHPELGGEFVLMNDDFYILEPTVIRPMHRGPLDITINHMRRTCGNSMYLRSLAETASLLRSMGYTDPLCYELHVPQVYETDKLRWLFSKIAQRNQTGRLHWQTLYGNMFQVGGVQAPDVKVYLRDVDEPVDLDGPFLSTLDASFPTVADRLEAAFSDPCRYEAS